MDIPEHCSDIQREKIRDYLSRGWIIDNDDGVDVLVKKGYSYRWIKRDGYSCAV